MSLELRGIDPRTSHMLSERSTIWATAPYDKTTAKLIINTVSKCQAIRISYIYVASIFSELWWPSG